MKIGLERVSATENGDYYQVIFETASAEGEPYVLIQRQFEEPDGGVCYVETHDMDYIGHARVAHASLSRDRFRLRLRRREAAEIEVKFNSARPSYREVVRIMRIMVPTLDVEPEDASKSSR